MKTYRQKHPYIAQIGCILRYKLQRFTWMFKVKDCRHICLFCEYYDTYLELAEVIDAKQRYSKQDIEGMGLFICKAYGDQFTVEELKNPETGLDAAGLILEFQFIDMGIADELTKRMENIEKNFQSGK